MCSTVVNHDHKQTDWVQLKLFCKCFCSVHADCLQLWPHAPRSHLDNMEASSQEEEHFSALFQQETEPYVCAACYRKLRHWLLQRLTGVDKFWLWKIKGPVPPNNPCFRQLLLDTNSNTDKVTLCWFHAQERRSDPAMLIFLFKYECFFFSFPKFLTISSSSLTKVNSACLFRAWGRAVAQKNLFLLDKILLREIILLMFVPFGKGCALCPLIFLCPKNLQNFKLRSSQQAESFTHQRWCGGNKV